MKASGAWNVGYQKEWNVGSWAIFFEKGRK